MHVGVVGAGRVFERLYLPALKLTPSLQLVAVCDPDPVRRDLAAGDGVGRFATLEEGLEGAGEMADGWLVLSPPAMHAGQVAAITAAGARVLVEKPVALSTAEMKDWPAGASALVTPAFPRRYWPAYVGVRRQGERIEEFGLVANPAAWGAVVGGTTVHPAYDLLPHLADLCRYVVGGEVVSVAATGGVARCEAVLTFERGRRVRCVAAHEEVYQEWVVVDGRRVSVGPPGMLRTMVARVQRRPAVEVAATATLLAAWAGAPAEQPPPGYADAWASVAVVEAALSSGASGGAEVRPRPVPATAGH